jgi:hypothetical protein
VIIRNDRELDPARCSISSRPRGGSYQIASQLEARLIVSDTDNAPEIAKALRERVRGDAPTDSRGQISMLRLITGARSAQGRTRSTSEIGWWLIPWVAAAFAVTRVWGGKQVRGGSFTRIMKVKLLFTTNSVMFTAIRDEQGSEMQKSPLSLPLHGFACRHDGTGERNVLIRMPRYVVFDVRHACLNV